MSEIGRADPGTHELALDPRGPGLMVGGDVQIGSGSCSAPTWSCTGAR